MKLKRSGKSKDSDGEDTDEETDTVLLNDWHKWTNRREDQTMHKPPPPPAFLAQILAEVYLSRA